MSWNLGPINIGADMLWVMVGKKCRLGKNDLCQPWVILKDAEVSQTTIQFFLRTSHRI